MSGWIRIEISAGTSIERASEDACRVANRLGINCEFEFNGVRCFATPQGYADLLAKRQQFEQARKPSGPYDRKFASSDPRISHAADEAPSPVSRNGEVRS